MNGYIKKFVFIILVLINFGWSQTISVPLRHWAYDAIERWEIQGFISTAFNGTRPITRLEMAEYIAEQKRPERIRHLGIERFHQGRLVQETTYPRP